MILKENKTKCLFVFIFYFFIITTTSIADQNRIELVSNEQIVLIKVLLNPDVIIKKSAAVKSSHHKKAYYIGLNFNISGIKQTQTGIWIISGDKYKPNGVLAVDGFAKNFSRATPAYKTNPPTAYSYDPECKMLKKYLHNYQ